MKLEQRFAHINQNLLDENRSTWTGRGLGAFYRAFGCASAASGFHGQASIEGFQFNVVSNRQLSMDGGWWHFLHVWCASKSDSLSPPPRCETFTRHRVVALLFCKAIRYSYAEMSLSEARIQMVVLVLFRKYRYLLWIYLAWEAVMAVR